ncbi:MAG TPA: efflux RND transporter periplasmic adaptor subunit [Casimicrobiaceae bacterium]|nr:efflux RND transporter periplasmic adaptor subunit [Casimicrobiaceae bacterium]
MNVRKLLLNRWLLAALAMLAVVGGGVAWMQSRETGRAQYRLGALTTGDVTQTVSANGTLNPVVLVNVGTQVSGTVKKLLVDFNDRVKAGQVLLELDPALLEAQVRQDEAALANARTARDLARANEARSQTLIAQEYISRQDFDTAVQARKSAEAQVAQATAMLAKDRTNLSYTVIRSPVSGVVVNRAVDIGQTVAASFQTPTLFQIAQDLRKMQIDSSFAEADIGRIKVGQPVQFTVDAFPDRAFTASVKQVRLNPTTQQNVVTYDVVIAVENPDEILMPGMTAYVNVIVARHSNVLLAPNAALRFRPAGAATTQGRQRPASQEKAQASAGTVYVLDQGRPRAVRVGVGISDGRNTEIASSELKAGDQVIVGAIEQAAEQATSTLRMRMF